MTTKKNKALEEHFEKLRSILPETYRAVENKSSETNEKLYSLLKSSLGIIEAVFLQHPESFSNARVDAYASIIKDLHDIGITYRGNEEILERAANQILLQAKKPMERAGFRNEQSTDSENQQQVS